MKLGQKIISVVASLALAGCMVAVAPAAEQAVTGGEGTSYTALAAGKKNIKMTMNVGDTDTLYITVGTKKIKGTKVSWKTSNAKVVTVTKAGKIAAKKAGTATITAKYQGTTYTCKVTVKDPILDTRAKLKKLIQKSDGVTGSGNPCISTAFTGTFNDTGNTFTNSVTISYDAEKDVINFYWEQNGTHIIGMSLPASTRVASIEPVYIYVFEDGNSVATTATMGIAKYTLSSQLEWDDDYDEQDNYYLSWAMDDWGSFLASNGVQMVDLGFTKIGLWK